MLVWFFSKKQLPLWKGVKGLLRTANAKQRFPVGGSVHERSKSETNREYSKRWKASSAAGTKVPESRGGWRLQNPRGRKLQVTGCRPDGCSGDGDRKLWRLKEVKQSF